MMALNIPVEGSRIRITQAGMFDGELATIKETQMDKWGRTVYMAQPDGRRMKVGLYASEFELLQCST